MTRCNSPPTHKLQVHHSIGLLASSVEGGGSSRSTSVLLDVEDSELNQVSASQERLERVLPIPDVTTGWRGRIQELLQLTQCLLDQTPSL